MLDAKQRIKEIDWADPVCRISKYFSVGEAIGLDQWHRLAQESDGLTDIIKVNLVESCWQWDVVREFLGAPMLTSDMYRPPAYNALPQIGGAPSSWHMHGLAIDFVVLKVSADEIRAKLLPMLPTWRVRMENRNGSCWVHLDRGVAFGGRYFFIP